MATVKLSKDMKDLPGWPEVAESLESMMEKRGLGGWNVIIVSSPPKEHYYRAEISREEESFLKSFLVICPPISLFYPKTEAKMEAGKILSELLLALEKEGKDPNPDSMEE